MRQHMDSYTLTARTLYVDNDHSDLSYVWNNSEIAVKGTFSVAGTRGQCSSKKESKGGLIRPPALALPVFLLSHGSQYSLEIHRSAFGQRSSDEVLFHFHEVQLICTVALKQKRRRLPRLTIPTAFVPQHELSTS